MPDKTACIECRCPKEAHLDGGRCPWEYKTRYATMQLPEGAHCRDCVYVSFCSQFIGPEIPDNHSCDWFPIRFVPKFKPGVETR